MTRVLIAILLLFFLIDASAQQTTKFGIYTQISGATRAEKSTVSKSFGVHLIRDGIDMWSWDGTGPNYVANLGDTLDVILNVNHRPFNTVYPFVTSAEMPGYVDTLTQIITWLKAQIPVVNDGTHGTLAIVIENEELAAVAHSGYIQDYINMLDTAISICHANGFKVADGGIRDQELCFAIYKELLKQGHTQKAADFRAASFSTIMANAYDNPGSNLKMDTLQTRFDSLIAYLATSDIDYVNLHHYDPPNSATSDTLSITDEVFDLEVDYLRKHTGKDVISNEMGCYSYSTHDPVQLLSKCIRRKLPYAVYFNGLGSAAKPLNDQTSPYPHFPNGNAVADFISKYLNQQ